MPSGEHKTNFSAYIERWRTFNSGSAQLSVWPAQDPCVQRRMVRRRRFAGKGLCKFKWVHSVAIYL